MPLPRAVRCTWHPPRASRPLRCDADRAACSNACRTSPCTRACIPAEGRPKTPSCPSAVISRDVASVGPDRAGRPFLWLREGGGWALDVDTVVDHAWPFMPSFAPVVPWLLALDPGQDDGGRGCGGCAVLDSISRGHDRLSQLRARYDVPALSSRWLHGVGWKVARRHAGRPARQTDDGHRRGVHHHVWTIASFASGPVPVARNHADSTRWVVMLDSSAMFSSGAWSPARPHPCL